VLCLIVLNVTVLTIHRYMISTSFSFSKGANCKDGWESVLLKTGVWDGVSKPEYVPDYVCDDVLEDESTEREMHA